MSELNPTRKEQKIIDRFFKVKSIVREEGGVGIVGALKMTWYLDKIFEKFIFIYGAVAFVFTILWILIKVF